MCCAVEAWQYKLENSATDIYQISCCQQWWQLVTDSPKCEHFKSNSTSYKLSLIISLCWSSSLCRETRVFVGLLRLSLAGVLSAGTDMRALTVLQCTAPFKRQRSASPLCHKACRGSLPWATRQADQNWSPDVWSGGRRPGALCRRFPVWPNICLICWQPTCSSHAPPLPILDLHIYVLKFSNISSFWQPHIRVCVGVRGVLQAQGWRRQLPFSSARCIIQPICPSVPLFTAASIQLLT